VRSFRLDDRVRFSAGDFFTDPIPAADVLVLGHVLHDWGLEQKQELIAKAYAALPEEARSSSSRPSSTTSDASRGAVTALRRSTRRAQRGHRRLLGPVQRHESLDRRQDQYVADRLVGWGDCVKFLPSLLELSGEPKK
jgi:O-methyltransferase domain